MSVYVATHFQPPGTALAFLAHFPCPTRPHNDYSITMGLSRLYSKKSATSTTRLRTGARWYTSCLPRRPSTITRLRYCGRIWVKLG